MSQKWVKQATKRRIRAVPTSPFVRTSSLKCFLYALVAFERVLELIRVSGSCALVSYELTALVQQVQLTGLALELLIGSYC